MTNIQKMFLIIAFLFGVCSSISAQSQEVAPPPFTLVAELPSEIVFQDLNTNRLWNWPIPNLIYDYNYEVKSWSSDGCYMVLSVNTDTGSRTILLSVPSLNHREMPLGEPIWSPVGESVFYVERSSDITYIYLASSVLQEPEYYHSLDMWIGKVEWLSDHEWVFSDGYEFYVWNLRTKQVRLFEPNPLKVWEASKTLRFYEYVGNELISPNWTMMNGFYSMTSYRAAFSIDFELSDSEIAELKTQEPTISGFDIFFMETGVERHVDVNGQFVQSLVWSPNSQQVAITTDYDGIDYGRYFYDLESATLKRIDDAFNDGWFWHYLPTWSPDGEWLAYRSSIGYAIQHLSSGQRIQLDETLNQSQSLHWIPAMDDTESSTC
jgi:Tol biopolymer transport system component